MFTSIKLSKRACTANSVSISYAHKALLKWSDEWSGKIVFNCNNGDGQSYIDTNVYTIERRVPVRTTY